MQYRVIRSDRRTVGLQVKNGELILRVPTSCTEGEIKSILQRNEAWIQKQLQKAETRAERLAGVPVLTEEQRRALARRARPIIEERVRYFAARMGVSYGRISIRSQRSRWGSCSAAGNLNFNCLLVLAPPEVLDSVVVHELCHRREMNHSPGFYAEVLRVMPNYRACHAWLRENGEALMARLGEKV